MPRLVYFLAMETTSRLHCFPASRVFHGQLAEQYRGFVVQRLHLSTQGGQTLEIAFAGKILVVEHDAIHALLALAELVSEIEIGLRGDAEGMELAGDFRFRILDAFGNFHLLLSCQQGHLAQLAEIQPLRVSEAVGRTGGDGFAIVVSISGFILDVHAKVAEVLHDVLDVGRIHQIVEQALVEVVVCQVALCFRMLQEFAEFCLDGRLCEDGRGWGIRGHWVMFGFSHEQWIDGGRLRRRRRRRGLCRAG